MEGIIFITDFVMDGAYLFDKLKTSVNWDGRMTARLTASYHAVPKSDTDNGRTSLTFRKMN